MSQDFKNFNPPLFIEVPVPSQESKRSCIFGYRFLPLSTIVLLDFGIIPTIWYFFGLLLPFQSFDFECTCLFQKLIVRTKLNIYVLIIFCLFSSTFVHFVFVYVICIFLYTIVNWIMRIKIYIIICVYTLTKINHNIEKNALNNTTRCIIIHIIILSYTSQMNKINKLVLEIRRIFCFGTRIFT